MRRIAPRYFPTWTRSDGEEIKFKRGRGGLVYDADDRAYFDFALGLGPVIIGHANATFNSKICEYLAHGIHFPGYSDWHEEYIERLLGPAQSDFFVGFFKTSSEAITAAFRIAALKTGRLGILRCGFLGWHDAALGDTVRWHQPPWSQHRADPRFTKGMRGIRGAEGVFDWVSLDNGDLRLLLDKYGELCGVFAIDAYQTQYMSPDAVRDAISACRDAGLVVVFDDTKTAGRYSKLGIGLDTQVDADLTVMGKALGNGAPLSLLLGDESIMSLADEAGTTGTHCKELLGLYAGLATLEIMDAANGYAQIKAIGAKVSDAINKASDAAGIADVFSVEPVLASSMLELRFEPRTEEERRQFTQSMADEGVLLYLGHPMFVCLAHAELDYGELETRMYAALTLWNKRRRAAV